MTDENRNGRGLGGARAEFAKADRQRRGRWFAGSSIAGAVMSLVISPAAYAQADASSPARDDAGIGNVDDGAVSDADIVITGTRLSTLRNAPNPVQSLDAREISQTGRTTALEILRLMPQTNNNIGGNTTSNYVNGAGLNIVDLRGMGPYRTLTLVNGRRQIGSMGGLGNSGLTSQVDINRIPVALIERVDVVTGGTSAQYGADAVAGVVNFILKDRFEGVDISATQRLTQDGGGSSTSVNAVFGAKFAENRGHIVVATSFDRTSPIYASQRDFAMRNISLLNNPANGGPADGIPNRVSVCCTLSSTTPASGTGLILTPIGSANPFTLTFSPDGSHLIPFNRGTQLNISSDPRDPSRTGDTVSVGGDGVNSSIPRVLQTPYRRLNGYMVADYLVSDRIGIFDDVTAFTEMSYSETQVKYDSAAYSNGTNLANPAFGALTIQADNPYVPADLRQLLAANGLQSFQIARANWIDQPSYQQFALYRVFQGVWGLKAKIGSWNVRGSVGYGHNDTTYRHTRRLFNNFNQQVDAVMLDGNIVCRDPVARAAGCVPLNVLGAGLNPASAYSYSRGDYAESNIADQYIATVDATGDLFSYRVPFSDVSAPISVAVGLEYRKESSVSTPNDLARSGITAIVVDPFSGSFNTKEAYIETNIPLLRDLSFAQSLDLNLAARLQKYSTTGTSVTWNARAVWVVNDSVRFRGGFARSIRAPSIDELFAIGVDSRESVPDPCDYRNIHGAADPAVRRQNCAAAGVPANFDSSSSLPSIVRGGNPDLKPEVANSFTAGLVFSPQFMRGLSLTADYYKIRIKDGIQSYGLPVANILSDCYDTPGGSSPYCKFLTRAPNGEIQRVFANAANAAKERVEGIDVNLSYPLALDNIGIDNGGTLSLTVAGTYLLKNETSIFPTDPSFDVYRAGVVGFPRVKGYVQAGYTLGGVTLTWAAQYIGKSKAFSDKYNPEPEYADFDRIGAVWYHDVSLAVSTHGFRFVAGINNLLDRDPPRLPFLYQGLGGSTAGANNNPSLTDSGSQYRNQGRTFFLTVGKTF